MDKLILVKKKHAIDKDFVPNQLVVTDNNENNFHGYLDPTLKPMIRKEVLRHFKELRKEALDKKLDIIIDSGYRSSDYQVRVLIDVYNKYVEELKNESLAYDKTMARVAMPGHSEHQTGLAFDMACFRNGEYFDNMVDSPEAEWMAKNAHKYGFILRYPYCKEAITGYDYEPWHFRFVGQKHSLYIYENDITFEEYHELLLKKKPF